MLSLGDFFRRRWVGALPVLDQYILSNYLPGFNSLYSIFNLYSLHSLFSLYSLHRLHSLYSIYSLYSLNSLYSFTSLTSFTSASWVDFKAFFYTNQVCFLHSVCGFAHGLFSLPNKSQLTLFCHKIHLSKFTCFSV